MGVRDRTILMAMTDVCAATVLGTIFQLHRRDKIVLDRGLGLFGFLSTYTRSPS